jgi:hypothetical protein
MVAGYLFFVIAKGWKPRIGSPLRAVVIAAAAVAARRDRRTTISVWGTRPPHQEPLETLPGIRLPLRAGDWQSHSDRACGQVDAVDDRSGRSREPGKICVVGGVEGH